MPKITLTGYQCNKCGHKWYSRNEGKPIACAGCKSPYWDREVKNKK